MSTLGDAIALAAKAHDGQLDKDSHDYIFHPLRVMESVRRAGFEGDYLIAAVLHDTIEDTDLKLDSMALWNFSPAVRTALDHLTRRKGDGELYFDYVARAKQNVIARVVKTHDVLDNLGRNPQPQLAKRYTKAYAMLNDLPIKED